MIICMKAFALKMDSLVPSLAESSTQTKPTTKDKEIVIGNTATGS